MRGDELEAEVSTQDQDILEDSSQQIQEVPPSSSTTFTIQDDSGKLQLFFFFLSQVHYSCNIYKLYHFPSFFILKYIIRYSKKLKNLKQ